MSLVKNDQLIELAPFWMTTTKTKTKGMSTSTSAAAISVLMMALLVVRQVRLAARPADSAETPVDVPPGKVDAVIAAPPTTWRSNVARSQWQQG